MIKLALLTILLLPTTACAAEAPEEKDWDVNNPPGTEKNISIDVTEGTWINVDVSPDGKTIVFDLLGDLFVIPVGGGEARQLTSGMAWDMQPRYSPDGSAIAFTSDRSGGDNIWILRLADDSFHPVSDEDFRLLNNPVWTPDGNYIAARKHFTSTRSAGAGEIWLYHRSGGAGVQMVARANEQKDINDPAFSPDGRYLYYDQDVTPGDTFEYNKDSNGEIYAIKRLDRKTGETITYVSGAGGSIRPTPSPDGKWLAFIRRVRFQSTLFLKNIESGDIFPVYDGMERDMQEIWAIHGVYTGMDWMPDSQSLVFWADGHIKRLNIESREVTTIPFHVEKDMEIRPALQFPVDIAPDTFKTRMLRWVTVSPDGDQAVFEALGHLYLRPLGNDKADAQRLTEQSTHFELQPTFSRDGRYLAYVTWDDEKLGTLRVRDLQTGEDIQLNRKPGHFVEPVFSPDGKTVVFHRITGGYLRAPRWDEHPGVYAVPADGSAAPRLVTKDGSNPQFGADNNRLFLSRMEKYDKRLLVSLELDGSDLRTHFTSTWATDFKVSPKGRWVAFQERYNVYIAPFTRSGQAIEIGPDTNSIPVQRVSKHGGNYLHWAGDGRSLHWSLGPKLMSRDLNQTFAFLEGGPEKAEDIAEPGADAVDLGFRKTFAVPDTRLALVGARILTMAEVGIIEDGVIIIDGNRISAVGPRGKVNVPADMPVLDVSGKTIMPGLVDVHWHGAQGADEFIPEQNWVNYASLAFGVTTLHDPSNDTSTIFAAAEMAKAGLITAPRIFSTGTILYGATTAFTAEIDSYEDALHHLKRLKAQGAFSVKSYNQPRRDQRQQVIAAARELEMLVVPEGGALFQHNMNMIVDGHTGIEHSLSVANVYDDVIQLWSQTNVGYTPTLGVAYGGLSGERYWYSHTNVWENERLLSFVPYWIIDPASRRRMIAPLEEYNHIDVAKSVNTLHDAGVEVHLGAHGQREGLAAHWGIWSFVQGGMTPLEALKVATIEGARYLGMDKDIGSLKAGKLADLIVLDDNPLENIRNSQNVHYVMVNGRLYDAASMNEIRITDEGKEIIERQLFFWEPMQEKLLEGE